MVVSLREAWIAPRVPGVAPLEGVATRRQRCVVGGVEAIAARAIGDRFGSIAGTREKARELAYGDLMLRQVEGAGDADLVHGRLVGDIEKPLQLIAREVRKQAL
jgi:hypothetical protein